MPRAAVPRRITPDFWILSNAPRIPSVAGSLFAAQHYLRNKQALMPSRKKPKPLFEVPVEIGSGSESGWVYRSEQDAPGRAPEGAGATPGPVNARSTSANPLALAIAALAQTFVLGVTIAAIPLTVGIAALQSL